jgi:hypothetical protein
MKRFLKRTSNQESDHTPIGGFFIDKSPPDNFYSILIELRYGLPGYLIGRFIALIK